MNANTPKFAKGFFKTCEKIEVGTFHIKDPKGNVYQFGTGQEPLADIHIKDWSVLTALAARGDIGLGETYVDGLWDTSSIDKIVQLAFKNRQAFDSEINGSFFNRLLILFLDKVLRRNNRNGSRKNIRAHYDVSNEFYSLWLDNTMTYSSALYNGDKTSLEDAQKNKYDRLLNAVRNCGERVLEIGCGWGGFAERAADAGHYITGITVSDAQREFALKRLGNRGSIILKDYRDINEKYDSIVSIEMIEAVGERYWPTYFQTLKKSLSDDGVAAIQAIIVEDDHFPEYRKRSDYIRHYTFPGGMLLSPGQIKEQAKLAGLQTQNLFRFGQDYARTLREWLERFEDAKDSIIALGFSEKFIRSWRFYLEICAASFAVSRTDVIQVEFQHS